MFRFNGDSNTTNNIMSHTIRRSPEAPFSQFALDSSASAAEQCLRDDRYFNLLYVNNNSNTHESTSRIHNVSENARFGTGSNSLDLDWLRSENENAWTNSLLDYRHMDAELALIQRECEQMEMNLASIGSGTENNKSTEVLSDCPSRGFNLVGAALINAAHSPSQTRANTSNIQLNGPSLADTLADIAYNLPPLAELSASNFAADSESRLMPASPIRSVSLEREAMGQTATKMKDNQLDVGPHEEPYKCPVCLKCVRQRKPVSTICGHVFCSSCIKTALRATCKCPVCQRLMTTRQIFRIFI